MIETVPAFYWGGAFPFRHNLTNEIKAIKDFLKDVFGTMLIGASGSLVELAVFDTAVHEIWTFDDNQTGLLWCIPLITCDFTMVDSWALT